MAVSEGYVGALSRLTAAEKKRYSATRLEQQVREMTISLAACWAIR